MKSSKSALGMVLALILCGKTWAATPAPVAPDQITQLHAALVDEFNEMISAGQYMRTKDCTPATGIPAVWAGIPIEKCPYTSTQMGINVTTTAYLIFPSADLLATWTVNACTDAREMDARNIDLPLCTGILAERIWDASAGQFPVAGYVVEPPMSKTWKYPNEPYCYLFRDGVTVTTESWPDTVRQSNNACGPDVANEEGVVGAKTYGRVASVTRSAYEEAKGTLPVGTDAASSPQWSATVGAEFRKAYATGHNFLFYASVIGDISPTDPTVWTRSK